MMNPGAVLLVLCSYILGSIPSSFLVGKLIYGIDLREHGSGNVGATNALRVLGTLPGICVLTADIAKGLLAVWVGAWLQARFNLQPAPWWPVVAGALAMIGHVFTVFLDFRGGKGVATGAGVFLALAPRALGASLAIFILVVALTKYVSLGSIIAATAVSPLVYLELGGADKPAFILAVLASLMIIIRHRTNISRLLKGTENRLGQSGEENKR